MHSVPMSTAARNPKDSRLAAVRPTAWTHQPSAEFVRLSHLRKMRECEQVAAVCYRLRGGGIEFLLVRTRGSRRWTFPKGSAEPGLTHAQAAALEAFEEAGVHGRIEELSFAHYVRRERMDRRRYANRSSGKGLAVNAHLCEVMRLSPPQESNRGRTWFSVEDAKRRLCEERNRGDGTEFVRVVDLAVERIQRLVGKGGIVADRPQGDRLQQPQPRRDALQKDALQKVQFDFAGGYGRKGSFAPYARRQLDTRQSAVPGVDAHRRVLQCEVLEFGPPRELNRSSRWLPGVKRAKALGTGAKNG